MTQLTLTTAQSLIHTAHNISLHDESDHAKQQQTNDKPNQPPTEQEHKLKTNDIPCRLKAAGPSKPVHEVYIGGLEYGTSADDVRACLMDLNVDNIRKVNKISDDQSASSSFHVIIVADTIKETVYGVGKFPLGVIMKPFRLYSQDGANKHKHLISTKKLMLTVKCPCIIQLELIRIQNLAPITATHAHTHSLHPNGVVVPTTTTKSLTLSQTITVHVYMVDNNHKHHI